jgi:hypothetical protein
MHFNHKSIRKINLNVRCVCNNIPLVRLYLINQNICVSLSWPIRNLAKITCDFNTVDNPLLTSSITLHSPLVMNGQWSKLDQWWVIDDGKWIIQVMMFIRHSKNVNTLSDLFINVIGDIILKFFIEINFYAKI